MKIEAFKDLPLSREVSRSMMELGFEKLFPIQAQAIIPLLEGKDVIGQAQTGTGKTAAFGVPMVERLNYENKRVQGLVLAPTRELAVQVAENIRLFAKYTKLKVLAIYGGEPIHRQIRALENGVHIVVGTPGRLIDLINRGALNLHSIEIAVLDEADRMLDMGFIEDIEYILRRTPKNRQTALFSATIDETVLKVCNRYMKNPEEILVSKDEIALTQMKQYYMLVNPHGKFETLCNILEENQICRAIIFCKTRRGTSAITEKLRRKGYNAQALHAGFTQAQRDRVTNAFRDGRLDLLIATDVAARGLDIEGITHIINYDVPLEAPVYFHRIGRTARMGSEGTAITLVSHGELTYFNNIKALTKTTIDEIDIPQQDDSPIISFF
jgi:ATP-dependent RNA helicase DeaD